MTKTTALTKFGHLACIVADPLQRADIYKTVRTRFKGVKALCAATQSAYLIRAGIISGWYAWTADLKRALTLKGAKVIHFPKDLQPYDLVFTVDANHNNAPDHVYLFLGWLDEAKLVAEIIDNYNAHPAPRNVGASVTYKRRRLARGKMAFAMRLPEG